jgi:plastocyanin domain-containing protein
LSTLFSSAKIVAVGLLALAAPAGCASSRPETDRAGMPQSDRQVEITVSETGFHPSSIRVERGVPIRLVFTRTAEKSCLEEVIVYLSATEKIRRPLPLGKPVEIDVTFASTGELGYSCGMLMYGGEVHVR